MSKDEENEREKENESGEKIEKNEESPDELKYLLGNMGIDILLAINRCAKDFKTIQLFSGCPFSCVKGRIPVLLNLKLIKNIKEEYFITSKGINFLGKIQDIN